MVLNVPDSCLKIAIQCEPKARFMKWHIWKEKHMLLLRIQNLEEGSQAKKICEESAEIGWPWLGRDVSQVYEDLKIPDMNTHKICKKDLKKAVEASHSQREDLVKQFETSKKLEAIKNSYFALAWHCFHLK